MNSPTPNSTPNIAPDRTPRGPLLGVLSDTHGDVAATCRAVDEFLRRGVERIVHCGDVGAPEILEVFRRIPTDFVLGNCDRLYRTALKTEIPKIGGRLFDAIGTLEWRGKRVFWTHGNVPHRVDDAAFSEEWDLICCGHTHVFQIDRYNETIILNPGGICARDGFSSCCVVDSNLRVERLTISPLSAFYE